VLVATLICIGTAIGLMHHCMTLTAYLPRACSIAKFSWSTSSPEGVVLTNKPPSIFVAAAAAPNCVAAVLAVSRPVYVEVRLN
jgi:hypothetical protein